MLTGGNLYLLFRLKNLDAQVELIKILCHLQLVKTGVLGDRNGLDKDSLQPATGRADVPSPAEGRGAFQTINDC